VLINLLQWPHGSAWALLVWGLFILVGACWLPVVALQIWLKREADRVASVAQLSTRFHRLFRYWFALGVPAFAAVLILFYLMVAKPAALLGS
jgi:uncharacterized membrane protein